MEEISLPRQAKQLEKYILTLPAAKQLNTLSRVEKDIMVRLRDSVYSGRRALDIYSSSEDSNEQVQALAESIEHFKEVGNSILAASSYDLLGIADVAHLSALNEHIIDQLK